MLTLFPFETEIYRQHRIPVKCVGHPLADQLPVRPNHQEAKQRLKALVPNYDLNKPLLACLPGSRTCRNKAFRPYVLASRCFVL